MELGALWITNHGLSLELSEIWGFGCFCVLPLCECQPAGLLVDVEELIIPMIISLEEGELREFRP